MTKKAEKLSEGEVEVLQKAEAPEMALNVDKLAGSFVEAMQALIGKAGLLPKEVPPLPSEGFVVTMKPNLTFGERVWPIGSIIDLGDADAVESDEHENAFVRAVAAGEEWTEQLARYYPPGSDMQDMEAFSYGLYVEWVKQLNEQADITKLGDLLKTIPASLGDQREVPVIQLGQTMPERVVPVGWGKVSAEE